MQLIVSNAHQHKAPFVSSNYNGQTPLHFDKLKD